MEKTSSLIQSKSILLICLTLFSWIIACCFSWYYFFQTIPLKYGYLIWISFQLLHICWAFYWLWGLHNFWHLTLSAFFIQRPIIPLTGRDESNPDIAILYTTRNDFDEKACQSCLEQDYPRTKLYICDDSSNGDIKEAINHFASRFPDIILIRRPNCYGFKAGNLNYALSHFVNEGLFLICDADEIIPKNYVSQILPFFNDEKVGFVQTAHKNRDDNNTFFQRYLGTTINLFYDYWFPLRNRFGFVTIMGHGVIIRKNVWEEINGFPEIVAEDLGFASAALAKGFRGLYTNEIHAYEAYPETYKAFINMNLKITSGTIEYFKKEFKNVIKSRAASNTEKLDILITYSSCFFGLIAMINLFGGIILAYMYKLEGNEKLDTWIYLIYLISPFTPVIPLIIKLLKNPYKSVRYLLIATMAYGSAIPAIAVRTVENLSKIRTPTFTVTGQVAKTKQNYFEFYPIILTGIICLAITIALKPPGYEATIWFALNFILGPSLIFIESKGLVGIVAKTALIIPLIAFMVLLI